MTDQAMSYDAAYINPDDCEECGATLSWCSSVTEDCCDDCDHGETSA